MQTEDFTYHNGDNGEPLSALVHWSDASNAEDERSKPIGIVISSVPQGSQPPLTPSSYDPARRGLHRRNQHPNPAFPNLLPHQPQLRRRRPKLPVMPPGLRPRRCVRRHCFSHDMVPERAPRSPAIIPRNRRRQR